MADDYAPRVFKNAADQKLNYQVLTPKGYDAKGTEKYPLVLFLHGAGERGDDNVAQLKHCTKKFLEPENRDKYPCFVMVPQCPTGKKWVEVDWSADKHDQPEKPGETMQLVLETLASLQKEFRVDDRRLYVSGLSMGGYGTWDLAARYPDRFAAAAPICGGGDEKMATRLSKLPLWVFHGDQDTAVKPERSRNMIAAIEKAGGKPKYTEFKGVGHNSWDPAYADPALLEWMFAQRLPK
ncbi:MAG: dienelactone hydrolase family protein [Planctomycetales bacterium]|nr:dienelactone hydrolase family protein [Planctomycetales bacterium]